MRRRAGRWRFGFKLWRVERRGGDRWEMVFYEGVRRLEEGMKKARRDECF